MLCGTTEASWPERTGIAEPRQAGPFKEAAGLGGAGLGT